MSEKQESEVSDPHFFNSAYAPEFRQQMVALAAAGRRPSKLTAEFGCHETSIST